MTKKLTSIRLEEEELSTIKSLGINFSEWVSEKIKEELMNPEMLKNKIKEMEEKLKKMRKTHQNLTTSYIHVYTENKGEIEFLKETKNVLDKHPEYLEGRINLFCNKFAKIVKPTRKQFIELMNNVCSEVK